MYIYTYIYTSGSYIEDIVYTKIKFYLFYIHIFEYVYIYISGSYIEVIVPDEVEPLTFGADGNPSNPTISVNKTTAGAALAGMYKYI
jgi:hypothetical protein